MPLQVPVLAAPEATSDAASVIEAAIKRAERAEEMLSEISRLHRAKDEELGRAVHRGDALTERLSKVLDRENEGWNRAALSQRKLEALAHRAGEVSVRHSRLQRECEGLQRDKRCLQHTLDTFREQLHMETRSADCMEPFEACQSSHHQCSKSIHVPQKIACSTEPSSRSSNTTKLHQLPVAAIDRLQGEHRLASSVLLSTAELQIAHADSRRHE